jgi:hypothetical protein
MSMKLRPAGCCAIPNEPPPLPVRGREPIAREADCDVLDFGHIHIPWVKEIAVEVRRVPYDIAAIAVAIRAADGLPAHYARDIETGGAS